MRKIIAKLRDSDYLEKGARLLRANLSSREIHAAMKKLLLIFLIGIGSNVYGQTEFIDSLRKEYQQAKLDTSRIKFAIQLAHSMRRVNKDSSRSYASAAFSYAHTLKKDKVKVDAYRKIGNVYYILNAPDKALEYLIEARAMAEELKDLQGLSFIYNNIGSCYRKKEAYELAISQYEASLELAEKLENFNAQTVAINNLANIYGENLKDYDKAIEMYRRALGLQEKTGNKINQSGILMNIGLVYLHQKKYKAAIEEYEKGMAIAREIKHLEFEIKALVSIASIHKDYGNFPRSIEAKQKAIDIYRELGDKSKEANQLLSLSRIYENFEEYKSSISTLSAALSIIKEIEKPSRLGSVYNNIGRSLVQEGSYDSALVYLRRSVSNYKQYQKTSRLRFPLYNIGNIYQIQGQHDSATLYIQQSYDIAIDRKDDYIQMLCLSDIGRIQAKEGRKRLALSTFDQALSLNPLQKYPKTKMPLLEDAYEISRELDSPNLAIGYLEKLIYLKDSVYNLENTREITRLIAEHEFDNEKKALKQLQAEEIQAQEKKRQNILWSLLITACFLLILGGFYLSKQRDNRSLKKLNEELAQQKAFAEAQHTKLSITQQQLIQSEKMASLGQLAAGIAHEIKNPLNFVNNFAKFSQEITDELQEKLKIYENDFSQADAIQIEDLLKDLIANSREINQHGKRADGIIQSMMKHASGSRGKRQAYEINLLLKESSELALKGYKVGREALAVDLEMNLDEKAHFLEIVPQEISRVIVNILNNACDSLYEKQYTEGASFKAKIWVKTEKAKGGIKVIIGDNGKGINEEIKDKIFEPFFTTKSTGSGNSGLGLSLSHDIIVHGHQGSISVQSVEGEFSEFHIFLPLDSTESPSS